LPTENPHQNQQAKHICDEGNFPSVSIGRTDPEPQGAGGVPAPAATNDWSIIDTRKIVARRSRRLRCSDTINTIFGGSVVRHCRLRLSATAMPQSPVCPVEA